MKCTRLLAALLTISAADCLAQAPAPVPARPGLRPHRFDEDWRALCDVASRIKPLDRIKCLRISPDATLTIGGEWRERLEAADDPGFGLRQDTESALLHRLLLHTDLRIGDTLRGFVQLGFYEQTGRDGRLPPTDVDRLDLAQAFLDVSGRMGGGRATLRAGRQELSFGSSRLVAVREGPNARLAFDGVRGFWTGGERRVDVFAVRPVESRPGTFDNAADRNQALWGVYATGPASAGRPLGVDLYYLGYRRDDAAFAVGTARERRHSLGVRLFGEASGFDWDVEAVAQFGRFGARDIAAWTVASDLGFTLSDAPLRPRLSLKANLASGDRRASDGRLGTFNALYPKLPYFSEANLVAPANLIDLHPGATLTLSPTLSAQVGWDAIWRHRTADAIYTTPLAAVPSTAGRPGRFTGHQAIVGFSWRARPGLTVSGEYVHFEPGHTLENAGGKSVDFLVLAAGYRF